LLVSFVLRGLSGRLVFAADSLLQCSRKTKVPVKAAYLLIKALKLDLEALKLGIEALELEHKASKSELEAYSLVR
jgi:hypothetical protein